MYEQDNQQWAKLLETLLVEMNKVVNEFSSGMLTEDEIKGYDKRYLEILEASRGERPETAMISDQ